MDGALGNVEHRPIDPSKNMAGSTVNLKVLEVCWMFTWPRAVSAARGFSSPKSCQRIGKEEATLRSEL